MKLHVFSVKRRNWKATSSCSSLEKHISTTTLPQHINKKTHQIFCRPLWSLLVSIAASTLDFLSTVSGKLFRNFWNVIFIENILQAWIKASWSYTVYERWQAKGCHYWLCTCSFNRHLEGHSIFGEGRIWGLQKYFSCKIRDLVFCGIPLCFHEVSRGTKKKSVTSQRDSTIISYKYILY